MSGATHHTNTHPLPTPRYPYSSCEVFCCEIEAMMNKLVADKHLLDLLFSMLDRERPLNLLLAGYFGRVVCSLLSRRSKELVEYLKGQKNILEKFVTHLDVASIQDVIIRLILVDDPDNPEQSVMWLSTTNFIQLLFDKLANQKQRDIQASAAEILATLAKAGCSVLTV